MRIAPPYKVNYATNVQGMVGPRQRQVYRGSTTELTYGNPGLVSHVVDIWSHIAQYSNRRQGDVEDGRLGSILRSVLSPFLVKYLTLTLQASR